MRVCRHWAITRDVRKLKKYRDIEQSLDTFERLLAADLAPSDTYAGLRLVRGGKAAQIFKARVIVASLGGKRSGLRYVYEVVECAGETWAICLSIYVHQMAGNEEHEVRARLMSRSAEFAIDVDTLEGLEQAVN